MSSSSLSLLAVLRVAGIVVALGATPLVVHAQQLASNAAVVANIDRLESVGQDIGNITQMTFGPDGRLYVATLSNGIKRYDYSPTGGLSNELTVWSRPDEPDQGRRNGSLGVAFHTDPVLGDVMYLAPAVPFTFAPEPIDFTQDIIRLTDNDGDGAWGEAGEVNQEVVSALNVTDLHQINQMQIRGDTLYVGIGSRTRTGGDRSELSGPPSAADGEYAYTGAVNWIRDLTLLGADTSTPNIAGFDITNPESDVRPLTSEDEGKLTVYSTGLRNGFGLAFDNSGDLWVSMNQNENPLAPDELHQSNFLDDHQFPKKNEVSGDWKLNEEAIDAGFFSTFKDPVATLGNNASANGLDFSDVRPDFAGDPFIVRFQSGRDLLSVDSETGDVTTIATDFARPIDVLTDPNGNLLVGTHGGGGQLHRVVFIDDLLLGDFDDNGVINSADWVFLRDSYRQTFTGNEPGGTRPLGDLNSDLRIDLDDLVLFKDIFEQQNGAGSAAFLTLIPEPTAVAIALVLLTPAAVRRVR